MIGKNGGVSALLMQLQPSLITVHCFAHRLELAYKDTVEGKRLYESYTVLLMGLHYFYHKRSFQSLNETSVMPTRVGGTRRVGHMVRSIEKCLRGYHAIRHQLEDCVTQK